MLNNLCRVLWPALAFTVLICLYGIVGSSDFLIEVQDAYQRKCSGGVVSVQGERVLCTDDISTTQIGTLQ